MDFTGTIKCCVSASLVLLAALAGRAQDAAPAKPADDKDISTISAKSPYQQFKSDLSGSLGQYSLKSSVERAMNPAGKNRAFEMPRLTEEQKRQEEEHREWIYQDMNDLQGLPTLEEMAGMPDIGPDGRDKKQLSPVEKFYDGLDKKQNATNATTTDLLESMWATKEIMGTNGLSSMSLTMPALDYLLKDMSPDKASDGTGKTAEQNIVDTDDRDAAALKSQKREIEDFNRVLNHGADVQQTGPASIFTPFSELLNPVTAAMPASANGGPSEIPQYPPGFEPAINSAAAATPSFRPVQATVVQPAFSPAVTTRSAAPAAPAPVLKPVSLDPFKDNMPKRAF